MHPSSTTTTPNGVVSQRGPALEAAAALLGFLCYQELDTMEQQGGSVRMNVLVILLYYVLILRFSDVEYREVIAEKFGQK